VVSKEGIAIGLKTIAYGPYKSGKSVFGLTLAELGPIGLIDTEYRHEWYTEPAPALSATGAALPTRPFPYDNPRLVRPLPFLAAARGEVYLVQTQEIGVVGRAIEAWTRDPAMAGIVIDSGSVVWDLLQDTRDDSNEKASMLSWTPVKKVNRRLMYAAMSGGKHLIITAHTQEKFSKVGRELVVTGVRPWLEKKSPHWADLTLEFTYPDGCPHPIARVDGEGIGGQGGLVRGAILGDPGKGEPAITFGELVRRLSFMAPSPTPLDQDELDYRNQTTVAAVGGAPTIPEVDGGGR
jgi:hypothetical protein